MGLDLSEVKEKASGVRDCRELTVQFVKVADHMDEDD
jgi:hypothetical protein